MSDIANNTIDQQFVEYIVKSLVNNPDGVVVERRIDEKGVLLELTVSQEDLGRVIGKRGGTAQSLRTLLRALGTKNDARYNLKIVDVDQLPDGTIPGRPDRTARMARGGAPLHASDDASDDDATGATSTYNDEDTDAVVDDAVANDDAQEKDNDSKASRTRKELADLDDLDI